LNTKSLQLQALPAGEMVTLQEYFAGVGGKQSSNTKIKTAARSLMFEDG
jgi:hypothetical protein